MGMKRQKCLNSINNSPLFDRPKSGEKKALGFSNPSQLTIKTQNSHCGENPRPQNLTTEKQLEIIGFNEIR